MWWFVILVGLLIVGGLIASERTRRGRGQEGKAVVTIEVPGGHAVRPAVDKWVKMGYSLTSDTSQTLGRHVLVFEKTGPSKSDSKCRFCGRPEPCGIEHVPGKR